MRRIVLRVLTALFVVLLGLIGFVFVRSELALHAFSAKWKGRDVLGCFDFNISWRPS